MLILSAENALQCGRKIGRQIIFISLLVSEV